MPILLPNDPLLPSSVLELTEIEQGIVIATAQRTAESMIGAGRPLELTSFTEIIPVSKVMQSAQLSYWPVATDPVPVIEARQSTSTVYGRSMGTSQWITIATEDYILDYDGKVHLNLACSGWGRSCPSGYDEIRATYTSGFDFSLDSYEIQQIKGAIADLIQGQQTEQFKSGASLAQIEIFEEVKASTRYNVDASTLTALRNGLAIFKRYWPRGTML